MTLRQRIRFYQQLAVLMRAGVPIRGTFTRLREKIPGREVATVSAKLDAGERLGEAFAVAGFTPFETHLVAAGERSARLENIFDHLAQFWARELELRQALIQPLYYPIFVMHLAVALSAGLELLPPTEASFPVVLTHFAIKLVALYILGAIAYVVVRVTWTSERLRRFWFWVPIIGSGLKTAAAYRWISALHLEFGAGISLYRAVGDAWHASGFNGSERLAAEGEQAMLAGTQLSTLVRQWRQLPRDWIDFIETGEISGAFETAFENLEAEAARAWKLAQQRMTEWVPRIVYFFVLLIVAFQIIQIGKTIYVDPIVNAEKQIDDAGK